MSYIVPLEIPQYCNKCPFGMCQYNKPLWSKDWKSINNIDGKENLAGTYGYVCNVEFAENERYTKVLRAEIGNDIEKPNWCKLKEMRGDSDAD